MGMKNFIDKSGKPAKVGKVRIKVKDDGKLYVAYWSVTAGKTIVKLVEGSNTYNSAMKHAAKLNTQLSKYVPSAIEVHSQVSVRVAMEQGLEHSRSKCSHHRANLKRWEIIF